MLPDAKYGDFILAKLINAIMYGGNKSKAEKIVYGAMDIIRFKGKVGSDEALVEFVKEALVKVKPQLEVKSRRVGGATYQVPMEVKPDRAQALAIRWIIEKARNRSENTMTERLAGELMDANNETGGAIKKRDDTHKMAEANRAFAHFRW